MNLADEEKKPLLVALIGDDTCVSLFFDPAATRCPYAVKLEQPKTSATSYHTTDAEAMTAFMHRIKETASSAVVSALASVKSRESA